MFNDGGLKDQGNTTDPVSGNDVPSGSLKEEVRDDIDAKLSPGEFVFPADVVRFIGLEKLMMIRDKAKKGLSRMEEMGQMGNSDEATIDDDVPFGMEDLIIVSGGPENEMSKGGVPSYSRGGQLIGDIGDGYQPPTRYHNPATGQELMVTKIAGKFFPPLPKGFVPKPTLAQANPTSSTRVGTTSVLADDQYDETVPGDPINTGINSDGTMTPQESAGGEMRGNAGTEKSTAEMSPSELADYGDFANDYPTVASAAAAFGNYGTDFLSNPMGIVGPLGLGALTNMAQSAIGSMNPDTLSAPSFPDDTPTERKAREKDFKAALANVNKDVGIGTLDLNKTREMAFLRSTAPDIYAQKVSEYNSTALGNAARSVQGQSTATIDAALSFGYGASPQQVANHADNVSRGNSPQGSTANAVGGYTTVGPNTTHGFSTNKDGEIDYKQTQIDRALRDAKVKADKDFASSSPAGTPDVKGSVDEMQTQDPAETGTQTDETSSMDTPSGATGTGPDGNPTGTTDTSGGYEASVGGGMDAPGSGVGGGTSGQSEGQAAEEYDGGLIVRPKKKKQKKMKRGGLASRK